MIFRLVEWGVAPVSLFFIYLFLPLGLFCYYSVAVKHRPAALLAISVLYYLLVAPLEFPVIAVYLIMSYLICMQIVHVSNHSVWRRQLMLTVLCLMSALFWAGFSVSGYGDLPYLLGISVLPFLVIDLAIRLYHNTEKELPSVSAYLLTNLYFPALYVGPIMPYPQLQRKLSAKPFVTKEFLRGMGIFVRGSFQFAYLGSRLLNIVIQIEHFHIREITSFSSWLAIILIGLGVYHVHAGINQITRGISAMFGIAVAADVRNPFGATSVNAFIARLHHSLMKFFKKNINRPLIRPLPYSGMRYLLLIFSAGLFALWFEFSMGLFVWGIFLGVFAVLERTVLAPFLKWGSTGIRRVYFFTVLLCSFALMETARLGWSSRFITSLVRWGGNNTAANNQILYLFSSNLIVIFLAFLFASNIPKIFIMLLKSWFPTQSVLAKNLLELVMLIALTIFLA